MIPEIHRYWKTCKTRPALSVCVSAIAVQSFSLVWLFATPWTAARQASLSITNSWSLLKFMCIESVKPSNHLILCRPLLLLPSIFPRIRMLSNESAARIRCPKYWSVCVKRNHICVVCVCTLVFLLTYPIKDNFSLCRAGEKRLQEALPWGGTPAPSAVDRMLPSPSSSHVEALMWWF